MYIDQTYQQVDVKEDQVKLGIAVMEKKLKGGPLKAILNILSQYKQILLVFIEEKTMLNFPVEVTIIQISSRNGQSVMH